MENLSPEIVGVIVALLGSIATFIKSRADVKNIKEDRSATAVARDRDSQELHDMVLKHGFMISELKDNQAHHAQVFDDLRDQVCALNVTVAELTITIKNLMEKITELKKEK